MQTNYTYVASYSTSANTLCIYCNSAIQLVQKLLVHMCCLGAYYLHACCIPVINSEFCSVIDYALSFIKHSHVMTRHVFGSP